MIRIHTLPEGIQEVTQNPEQYRQVAICILLIAARDIPFSDLCNRINEELPLKTPARIIADYCITLQELGLIRIVKQK